MFCVCTIHTAVCNSANNCCNGKLKPFELFADELEWNFFKKKVRVCFLYYCSPHRRKADANKSKVVKDSNFVKFPKFRADARAPIG